MRCGALRASLWLPAHTFYRLAPFFFLFSFFSRKQSPPDTPPPPLPALKVELTINCLRQSRRIVSTWGVKQKHKQWLPWLFILPARLPFSLLFHNWCGIHTLIHNPPPPTTKPSSQSPFSWFSWTTASGGCPGRNGAPLCRKNNRR